jgi:uncharacterized protein (TIGR01777 family)
MGKRVVLAGGSGFLGEALGRRYLAEGYDVTTISRHAPAWQGSKFLPWDGKTLGGWAQALEGADLLVNLAGKSVDCRYNERNRKDILSSRVDSTRVLGEAIEDAKLPPKVWFNSSTATIYRHAEDRPMDEATGEIGSGFSVEVATQWEEAFWASNTPKTRKTALRTALVLGKGAGVLSPLYRLARLGLGGTQGSGRQMFSWVHEEDFFRILRFMEEKTMEGTVNCTAPGPVMNREWMAALRKALKVPFGLPAPRFLLELGTFLLRTESELVLKSRWVIPTRLLQAGFKFKYPTLPEALADLV